MFNGESYPSKSVYANAQRTINWYPENDPTGKNNIIMYPAPGLVQKVEVGVGPIRGELKFSDGSGNDILYVVSGAELYSVTTAYGKTLLGTLNTSSGDVSMAHNGKQAPGQELIVVDGTNGYTYNIGTYPFFSQIKEHQTGSATSVVSNELNDTAATFQTNGVKAGMVVYNTTDSLTAIITSVDSETQLTLDTDIFNAAESYTIGDADFPDGCTHVAFFNGRFFVNDLAGTSGQTGAMMWSASYDGTSWAALDFATAEHNPDDLLAIKAINKTLYLMGEYTTELWFATQSFTKPFQPQTTIGIGVKAANSVKVTGDKLIWLGTDERGQARLYVMAGAQFQAVSNSALEQEWDSLSATADATAFVYEQDGHTFYELSFPAGDKTYVFDILENRWHERSSYNGGAGGRHLINHAAFFNGITIVGDSTDGNLYEYSSSTYQDNGVQIVRTRTTQHIAGQEDEFIRHVRVKMEFQQGVGTSLVSNTDDGAHASTNLLETSGATFVTSGVTAGTHKVYNTTDNTESEITSVDSETQLTLDDDIMASGDAYVIGIDPRIALYWSDDGGNVFKGPIYRNLGLPGNYIKQQVFANLGRSRDRIYKIECSDNANYTLVTSWAEGQFGDHFEGSR